MRRQHDARVVDAERAADAGLPVLTLGDHRPRRRCRPRVGRTACPHVDVRRARDQHVGVARPPRRAGPPCCRSTRWSSRTPSRCARARGEARQHLAQVVGAVEALDDDALDAQVVAPHLLDQLGVVHAFHPDPAPAQRRVPSRPPPRDCPTRCGDPRRRARAVVTALVPATRAHRDEVGGRAVDREGARQVAVALLQPGVPAQYHLVAVERDQVAREPGRRGAVPEDRAWPRDGGTGRRCVRDRRSAPTGSRRVVGSSVRRGQHALARRPLHRHVLDAADEVRTAAGRARPASCMSGRREDQLRRRSAGAPCGRGWRRGRSAAPPPPNATWGFGSRSMSK